MTSEISHGFRSTTPPLIEAINDFGWFAKNDKFVAGGAGAVASTVSVTAPRVSSHSPPQCYLHQACSFLLPRAGRLGVDADFFCPAYAGKDLGKLRFTQARARWR
ncbi:MAG: hypothetical protein R3D61_04665 [Defluviimonas denitrificans]